MAQPVAQCHQAAERPHVGGDQAHRRILGAQRIGGEVEDQVVGTDRDDGALDLRQPPQQLDGDPLPRVVALHARRDPSKPSARTSEVSTPAPRGSGEATTSPPTEPSRTRTQSSIPTDGGSFGPAAR